MSKPGPPGEIITPVFGGKRREEPPGLPPKRPITDVVDEMFTHLELIVRSEMRLARAEASDEVLKAARQTRTLMTGLVLGFFAVDLLLLSAVFGLAYLVPVWLASLIVGIAVLIPAVAMYRKGRRQLGRIQPAERPKTSKEPLQWTKKPNP